MSSTTEPLACHIQIDDPVEGGDTALGELNCPVTGMAAIYLISPRPIRLWIDGVRVLDEDLWWRRYERQIRALIMLALEAGRHKLRVLYGPRSVWPAAIDRDCPSRNRERVREDLRRTRPDRFQLNADVQPDVRGPDCCLRILPAQCVSDGIIRQHVLARRLADAGRLPPPGLGEDQPTARSQRRLAIRSAVAPYAAIDASDQHERIAGVQRFLVPVANRHRPLPLARALGEREERLEPECIVVGSVALTVREALEQAPDSPDAEAALPAELPAPRSVVLSVHENRGRLAPQREHRMLNWPGEDTLLVQVPCPLLPKRDKGLLVLHDHAWRLLRRLRREVDPRSGLPNDFVRTARVGFPHQIYVWDSSFTAMCTAWAWRVFPTAATLDCLYSRQFDGGYIPRETDVREGDAICWEPDFSPNPPLQALAEWKMALLSGNTARLETVYPILCAQHHWLRENRRLNDGCYWTTGLANGLDNSPSLGDGYPDLTAQQVQVAEVLGDIAALLGRDDEATVWRAERQETAAAMNAHLWSNEMQFFSTSLPDGGHNPNKVVTGFWPLWTGLVPSERIAACARHLLDPRSFWRHHPVPSLAADSPAYCAGGDYWRGSVWAPTNAATAWGFARAGRHDLARRLVHRHLTVMLETYAVEPALWENYCPENSGPGSISNPDYSWTTLGPIALLYEVLIGIQPDALRNCIRWVLPGGGGWGLERIPLGAATVDLRLEEQPRRIVASCDQPFTLELVNSDSTHSRQIPAGRWTIAIDELHPVFRM
jgi:hypothetical protein